MTHGDLNPGTRREARGRGGVVAWVALGVLALAAIGAVGVPAAAVVASIASSWNEPVKPILEVSAGMGGARTLLLNTVVAAAFVASVATVIALPVGWALRRLSRLGLALVVVPLMMPAYLAYAAYNTLREGPHALGRLLGGLPSDQAAALSVVMAHMGMVLWVWPVAAVVLASGFSRVPERVLEAMKLDGAGRIRRGVQLILMCPGAVFGASGLVAVLMLGSAVPLHLAQVRTIAIAVWKLLDLYTEQGIVWRAAWPVVALAVLSAELMCRVIASRGETEGPASDAEGATSEGHRFATGRIAAVWSAAVWCLAVPIPVALFVYAVRDWRVLSQFWHEQGDAVGQSAAVAGVVGLVCAGLSLCVWLVLNSCGPWGGRGGSGTAARRAGLGLTTRAFVVAGLLPGVLIGAATARTWGTAWEWSSASGVGAFAPLVAAHVARVGFLGVLAGWVLWQSEPRALREVRALEPGSPFLVWWCGAAWPRLGVVAGVGLATAALSFHEIEASVILQPPGTASMARRLLEFLHYLKDQQVAAAAVNLMVLAIGIAIFAGWLLSGVRKDRAAA